MRTPAPGQQRFGGMLRVLVATLALFGRLIAPALAFPDATGSADVAAALQTICHAGAPDGPAKPPVHDQAPGHDACLLCPACHLLAQVGIPVSGSALINPPNHAIIALAAPPPPGTGPPSRTWQPVQQTGPPPPSA